MKLAPLICLVLPMLADAQAVYRCETGGKVAYSDAPCVGAKVIDATPTQGMDKMAGRSSKGREVRRAEFHQALDGAMRPLTGKSTAEMDTLRRRVKLSPSDRQQCQLLDARLPHLAHTANTATVQDAQADVDLYQARKRHFDLRC